MKFIHSADWHLGNRMHNVERKEEFQAFLSWLKSEIENQKAETLVIAGDIFDTANPPTDARTQYNNFLASLLRTCCRNVIIVGGNHDSGVLLDSQKDILNALNIHVVGTIANLEPSDMVFELKNDADEVIGICAAVPFAHENELREYSQGQDVKPGELADCGYAALYKMVYEEADKLRDGKNIPIIATGHLYAANLEGRFSASENEEKIDDGRRQLDVVGNLGSIHIGTFPKEFDYVALGHIHYPTMVAKNPKVRYSGSPFVLGFDEHDIKHCILSVEVENGDEPKVKKIEVPQLVLYNRISGKCDEIEKEIDELIKESDGKEINIEINYDWEDGLDINDFVEKMSQKLPENMAIIHKKRNENQNVSGSGYSIMDEGDVEDLKFEDIFRGRILEKCEIDKTNLTEEEIKVKQDEMVDRYLSLLMTAVNDFDNGVRYED